MDNLDREMILCEKAGFGVSYGKWKATQPIKTPKPKEGVCVICGCVIPDGAKNKRYCSKECRVKAGYNSGKPLPAYSIEYGEVEQTRECAYCGKTFYFKNKRKIYCNVSCNALATYYRKKGRLEAEKTRNDKAD